ncbi:dihydrofolate reductase family protein [Gallaecimonas mangrovi]|uniref:dihydrofolate reductase family protein n=1 Tax=Gallaecimonas mangrovi TaxID=2291597 RepID=UPI000E20A99F|nr:dihydrofolate reductase family protein [Gallaecimonas mangrovi]
MSTRPTVTLYIAISLDGFIIRPKGQLEWLSKDNKTDEDYGYNAFFSRMDGLIMGRNTFDDVLSLGVWPYSGKTAYVLTDQDDINADGVIPFTGTGEELMAQIGQQHQQLWLVGGSETVKGFLNHGLVDEVILSLLPVTKGEGNPLFLPTGRQQPWKLAGMRTFGSGLVQLHYHKEAA